MYFHISEIRDVVFHNVPPWARDGVMAASPYRNGHGWHLVGRGFTKAEPVNHSHLFVADGENPFEFTIRPQPLLSPGPPGSADELAVEDPTVIERPHFGRGVLYSQVRRKPAGEAPGSGGMGVSASLGHLFQLERLEDRWAAPEYHIPHTVLEPKDQRWWKPPLDMCKEAEILLRESEESDVLFYEFSDGEQSRIAVADTELKTSGRITTWNSRLWLDRCPGMWDSDHVSTGPIVRYRDVYLMFYNGQRTITDPGSEVSGIWAVGELLFHPTTLEIIDQSKRPLIEPTVEIGWANQRIAFSSGAALDPDGTLYLYYHEADERVRCAVGRLR